MIIKISFKVIIAFLLSLNVYSILPDVYQKQFEGKITYAQSRTLNTLDGKPDSINIAEDSISIWAISEGKLVAKYIGRDGYNNETYVRMGDGNSFIYYPDGDVIDYYKLPNVTNYKFVKQHKKSEEILGHKCTKYEYTLNENTQIFFWVANKIKLKNHGEFFNFISIQNHLVLKRQLIWSGGENVFEAINIDNEVSDEDFNFAF